MTKSIDVVREIYAAFEGGDMERVFGLLDEDIAWIEPAGYWVSPGGVRGLAEVERTLAAYPERWTENVLEPETFLEAGDHVVVLGGQHGTARETGRSYRGRFANVWLVRDGKAVSFEAFSDTALMWKALGGMPAA
ncbi:nuclear transport factor 2 family protein [Patulibacter defluvii]|uniref:nuclear transport factor 2 family protein n=1 Tax=Patulibacter defluvii TaxID=3095358 RepID=UPI002A763EF0|nr:nuclear transport factor 2 family protein [Patulibacter sp. DM4]